MKNVGKKVCIIVASVIIVVVAILAFYSTIVSPPVDVPEENLHKVALEKSNTRFSSSESYEYNDSVYRVVVDKLATYKSESFVESEDIDAQTMTLVQKYVPLFTRMCNKKFNASVWYESDHSFMLERIEQLRSLMIEVGSVSTISGDLDNDLEKIEEIINKYNKAKKVARYSRFTTIKDAKSKIKEAEKYRTMTPLKNCTELNEQLANVKRNIGNSHFRKLEQKVDSMKNYKLLTEENFNKLKDRALGMLIEYQENCSIYKEAAKQTDELETKAGKYLIEAKDFYIKKDIHIFPNNSWSYISDENGGKVYGSYSNYHEPKSSATMYFTIKGYETFTFYIKGAGEKDYDYVMVRVDEEPTRSDNYKTTTTKGIYNKWQDVTLSCLDKAKETTIYVTYSKDINGNEDPDKGFVWIPIVDKNYE